MVEVIIEQRTRLGRIDSQNDGDVVDRTMILYSYICTLADLLSPRSCKCSVGRIHRILALPEAPSIPDIHIIPERRHQLSTFPQVRHQRSQFLKERYIRKCWWERMKNGRPSRFSSMISFSLSTVSHATHCLAGLTSVSVHVLQVI